MKVWETLMIRFIKDLIRFAASTILIIPVLSLAMLKEAFNLFHEMSQYFYCGLENIIKGLRE